MPDKPPGTDAGRSDGSRTDETMAVEPEQTTGEAAVGVTGKEHAATAEEGQTTDDAVSSDEAATADDIPAVDAGDRSRRLSLPGSRRGKVLLAAALALVLGVGIGGLVWMRVTSLPDDAAFAYGDRIVTIAELDARVDTLRALYGVQPPTDQAQLDTFRRDAAKSVAVSMVLDRAAADRDIVIADKQARDVLDRFVVTQFAGDRDAFVRTLGNVGTSERAVVEEMQRQLAVGRLMKEVVGEVSIDDERLRTAFEERREQLGTPERRVLRNVVVASEQDARAVLDLLRVGTPVEEVAAQHSLDGSTKQSGGMLGAVARQQLEAAVGEAAFAVPGGQLYGPVQGQHGWNVGRVDQIQPMVPAEFETVREPLRQTLQAEEALERWRRWLGDQITGAEVRYADAYRPVDPNAAPAVGAPPVTMPGGVVEQGPASGSPR